MSASYMECEMAIVNRRAPASCAAILFQSIAMFSSLREHASARGCCDQGKRQSYEILLAALQNCSHEAPVERGPQIAEKDQERSRES